jgi:hypothetical protein
MLGRTKARNDLLLSSRWFFAGGGMTFGRKAVGRETFVWQTTD